MNTKLASWLIVLTVTPLPTPAVLAVIAYFVLVEGYAAVAFISGGLATRGVTHVRLGLVSLGTALLAEQLRRQASRGARHFLLHIPEAPDDAPAHGLYLKFGGYRPLSPNTQLALGVDTTGQSPINGLRRTGASPFFCFPFSRHASR